MKRAILTLTLAAGAALALAGTASAHSGYHLCPNVKTHSKTYYESKVDMGEVSARSPMNCASARHAHDSLWRAFLRNNSRLPRTYNDGYVTWHRTKVTKLWGGRDGCGSWGWQVTYHEYTSGTVFKTLVNWQGC